MLVGIAVFGYFCENKIVPKPSAMTGQLICWEDSAIRATYAQRAAMNCRTGKSVHMCCYKCSIHILVWNGNERKQQLLRRLRSKMMREKQALSEEHEQRKISEKRHKRAEQQARDEITAAERTQKDRNELGEE